MTHFAIFGLNDAPEPTGNGPYTAAYARALAAGPPARRNAECEFTRQAA